MDWKRILLCFVLVDFGALTAWAVARHGMVGLVEASLASPAAIALTVDLLIALAMISVWMVRDARDRGVAPLPYLALTLTMGSIGPLLYLVRHGDLGVSARS